MPKPVLALLALMLIPVPASAASPPLELIASRAAGLASDGERFVVFEPYQGRGRIRDRLVVLDTLTGRRRRLAKRRDCGPSDSSPPTAITSAGQMVLTCVREPRFVLLDLRSGATRPLPPTAEVGGRLQRAAWFEIGRHWVQGGAGGSSTLFLNWRTGELRRLGQSSVRDRDDPYLRPPSPCARFARSPVGAFELVFDPPYFLGGYTRGDPGFDGLLLRRCRGASVRLAPPGVSLGAQLAGGTVSWTRASALTGASLFDPVRRAVRVFAYDVASRRRASWRVPDVRSQVDEPLRLFHAHRSVFVAVTRTQACDLYCFVGAVRLHRVRPVRPGPSPSRAARAGRAARARPVRG